MRVREDIIIHYYCCEIHVWRPRTIRKDLLQYKLLRELKKPLCPRHRERIIVFLLVGGFCSFDVCGHNKKPARTSNFVSECNLLSVQHTPTRTAYDIIQFYIMLSANR